MAGTLLEFVVKARDDATSVLGRVSGAATDLRGVMTSLAQRAGAIGGIGVAAAGAVGGIVAAGVALADFVEVMDRAGKTSGFTSDQLQVLKRVTEEGGGSYEAVLASVSKLNKAMGEGEPLVTRLGLAGLSTFDAYTKLAGILSTTEDVQKRAAIGTKLLGKAGEELAADLENITTNGKAVEAAMRRTGAIMSGETLQAARKLDGQVDELSRTWAGFTVRMQSLTVPAAAIVVDALDAIAGELLGIESIQKRLSRKNAEKPREERIQELEVSVRYLTPDENTSAATIQLRNRLQTELDMLLAQRPITFDADRLKAIHGDGGAAADSLAGIKVGDDKKVAESPREKQLKEIERLMRVGRQTALQYLEALESLDRDKAASKMAGELRDAGVRMPAPEESGAQLRMPIGPREGLTAGPLAPENLSKIEEQTQAILDAAPRISGALMEVGTGWQQVVDGMMTASSLLNEGFGALYSGLQSGFGAVFANLTNKAQTFKSAMRTVFSALVQEVLALLARIAAAKVFSLVLKLIPGLGTAASVAADAAFAGMSAIGGRSAERAPAGDSAAQQITVNINALNARDAALSLLSPRGELRRAMERGAMSGAY